MTSAADPRIGSMRTPEFLASRENRWLKRFRAALAGDSPRKLRAAVPQPGDLAADTAAVGIEGLRLVETALRSGAQISAVLFSEAGERHIPALQPWIPASARLLTTTDRLFESIAATETPQGVAALVVPQPATFDDLVRGVPLILVLAGIQTGNVGTLLRAAEAFGATGAVACSAGGIGTTDPYGPKALRASAGSALRLPILRGPSAPVLLAQLRIAGVRVYATSPAASNDAADLSVDAGNRSAQIVAPWQADWRSAVALLIGNEGAGLPAELVRSADAIVCIPQAASAIPGAPMDSLNAAVAGAVLLYEAARQRG